MQQSKSYGLVFLPIGGEISDGPQGDPLRVKIGPGSVFEVLEYAGVRENAACPGKLTDLGGI